MSVLEIHHLKKHFGETKVIDDLSLTVEEHTVYGFIGKNGSGKTTTMKMILGFLPSSGGEILIDGQPVVYGGSKTNQHIGYLPDAPEFYGYMTPQEYLKLCGQITGLSTRDINKNTAELLELVGLTDSTKRRIQGFSRGMKQRLGMAQALLSKPRLLICDEPTSALDPIGRKDILDILSRLRGHTTVLFSTHVLTDVERICDTVGVLNNGRLVLEGSLADIRSKKARDTIVVQLSDPGSATKMLKILKVLPHVIDARREETTLHLRVAQLETTSHQILAELLKRGALPVKYTVLEPSLEDAFLEAVA